MEAYLVTRNQRRALRIQEPASSNPVQPIRAEDPQILEGHPVSIRGEKKAWELPEGAIVLEGIPVFPQAMNKQEHPKSAQDPPPELFEPFTMKKIPAPPPSEEVQEPVQLEEEFDPVLPSQSLPEEVINISSLLTHPGDVSDSSCVQALREEKLPGQKLVMPSPLHALGSESFSSLWLEPCMYER
ncbi:hypothetical protein Zm00014a_020704 [Zea mays]|uniref:Uncharacterized protein n=1 Tax=Zea mays TaxID=4577 RepID=A0A3L6D7I6_MAIZE|nr:hypothetical protein Zm00014a_020704 [Zea mays]